MKKNKTARLNVCKNLNEKTPKKCKSQIKVKFEKFDPTDEFDVFVKENPEFIINWARKIDKIAANLQKEGRL